jgi:hypothetical protein
MATPPVHHDIMIARFDKAAKDEVEAEELAGEGHGLWTARVNPKTQARVGRTIDLAVDTCGFHFFDKDTGLAIGHPDINTTDGELCPPGPTPAPPLARLARSCWSLAS